MNNKLIFFFVVSLIFAGINLFLSFFMQDCSVSFDELSMYPVIILFLCLAFGWMKKEFILSGMNYDSLLAEKCYLIVGILILLISMIIPISGRAEFAFFVISLTFIGTFFMFFGQAAYFPSLFLFVYGFSVSFPIILTNLYGTQFAVVTTMITANIANIFYPVTYNGQIISIINNEGIRNLILIDAACSGSASLAIFLTVFSLMLIDIKPQQKYMFPLFIFGIAGTTFQNILRLVILLSTNYHLGGDAMWKMHDYAGYVLFPIWFSIFIYVYLVVGVGKKKVEKAEASVMSN